MTTDHQQVNQTPNIGPRAGALGYWAVAGDSQDFWPTALCFANRGLLKPVCVDARTRRGFKLTLSASCINFEGGQSRIHTAITICDLGGFGLVIDGREVIGPAPRQAMAVSPRILAQAEWAVQTLFRSKRNPTADEVVWASGDATIGTAHLADLIVYGRIALEVSTPLSESSRVYPIDAGFEWARQRVAPCPKLAAACREASLEVRR